MKANFYKLLLATVFVIGAFSFVSGQAPYVTVTSPNGGETWLKGSSHTITWVDNLTSNVIIDLYSGTSSATCTYSMNIAASVGGNSYSWVVPNWMTPGTNYFIKISRSVVPEGCFDVSDNPLTISGSLPGAAINVTAPSGNPNILRNSNYNIQWTKTNVPENVKIELFNPLSGYSTLTASVSGSTWGWWVPFDLPVASGYKIRVSSTNDSGIKDEETFSVALSMGGTVTLITPPIATATYPRNSTMTIAWNKLFTENVKIELWNPGTSAYETLAWSVSGTTWAWWIPSYMTPANGYKIKVSSVLDPLINSENDFNIAASSGGTIMLSSPAGGETWLKNTTHALSWIKTFSENVKIELWNPVSAAYELLAWSVGGTSWDWYIPHYMTSSAGYKIKVSSTLDPMISQEHTFTIGTSAGGSVIIGTPAIGSTYARNSKMTIAWTTTFPENVKIELWNPITSAYELLAWSVSGTTWDWWIPSYITPTVGYRVKISSTLDPLIADEHIFAIALSAGGTVFLTSPTSGVTWVRNTSQTITWTKFFTEDVRIELLDPTTATWGTLAWSIGGSSFTWWIPNWQPAANGYTMRVSSVLDPSIRNEVTFNIAATAPGGTLTITAPLTGTTWVRNTNHAITWTKSFSDDVKIELYNPFNGGGTWEVLAWSVGGNSWDWWIPNTMQYGTNYYLRVSRVADPSVFKVKQFTIAVSSGGTVAFTNPLGGENWVLGTTHMITWGKLFPENVRLELFNPTTASWGDLAWSVGGTSWEWWIPNYFTPASGYQLRVSSVLDPTILNVVSFNVVLTAGGTVTLTSPNGGEWWGVNTTHPITWTKTIAEDVKIELQKPDLSYETLTWATSGTSWSWWIPNYMPEGTYKIKISSVLVPGTFDESADVFHIAIYDLVTYPNPVVSSVTLKTDLFTNSNCTVEVFNHFGVRVQSHTVAKQATKEYTMSMEGLPNNVYSIVVTSDSKRISKSVIVQH